MRLFFVVERVFLLVYFSLLAWPVAASAFFFSLECVFWAQHVLLVFFLFRFCFFVVEVSRLCENMFFVF